MRKTIKGFLAGVVVTTIVFSTVFSVNAASVEKMITVFLNNIKIYVEGSLIETQNADGSKIEPFIHKGTTYLPVRAVSQALGKNVTWDGDSNSIYIGAIPVVENEVIVETASELLEAMVSNRKVLLKPGIYNLSELPKTSTNNKFAYWQKVYDGHELVFKDISNLTIEGIGEGTAEIIVEPRYATVLNFINAENINISNVKIGHTEQGQCAGGVFYFEDSKDIQISSSDLYGCGTYGLELYGVENLKLIDSKIYECSNGIMVVRGSKNLEFINCEFVDNQEYDLIYIFGSNNVIFDGCKISNNITLWDDNLMFNVLLSSNIVVKNSQIINNKVGYLVNDKDAITFLNTEIDNVYMGGLYGN